MLTKSSALSMSAVVAKRTAENVPVISMIDFSTIGNGMARVVMDIVHNRFTRDNHNLVAQAISQSFDNKIAPVEYSFDSLSSSPMGERITGVVRVNTEAIPVEDAAKKGFKSVSSNIFFDTEDKMWSLQKSASGEILVKNTGIEDESALHDLLGLQCMAAGARSLSNYEGTAMKSLSAAQNAAEGGDFIDFINASGQVQSGFVVASVSGDESLVVLGVNDEDGVEISRSSVLQRHDVSTFPDPEFSEQEQVEHTLSISRGAVDVNFLLDYYKKVYRRSPEFYKKFADRVRSHAFM